MFWSNKRETIEQIEERINQIENRIGTLRDIILNSSIKYPNWFHATSSSTDLYWKNRYPEFIEKEEMEI